MMDFELEQLQENPQWLVLLQAYRQEALRIKDGPAAVVDFDGWVERLSGIDGIRDEHLSRAHGKLIALGLLNFQLTGRTSGVRYQVSARGLRMLSQAGGPSADRAHDASLRRSA